MSLFSDPFNSSIRLRCECGQHASLAEHEASRSRKMEASSEAMNGRVVEQAVMRALFPDDSLRRRFYRRWVLQLRWQPFPQYFHWLPHKKPLRKAVENLKKQCQSRFYSYYVCNSHHHGRPDGFYKNKV